MRALSLTLGNEVYAIDVLTVREIIRPMEISPVPRMPAEFLGVINLRGKIVPVVDLRIKFGLKFTGHSGRTCIVVVQTEGASGPKITGLLVDEVREVMTLNPADIEAAPNFGAAIDTGFIRGLAKTKQGVLILLDMQDVVDGSKTELAQ